MTEFSWKSKTRVIYHLLDHPCHHTFFHNANYDKDNSPNGLSDQIDPKKWYKQILQSAKDKKITYFIAKVSFFCIVCSVLIRNVLYS